MFRPAPASVRRPGRAHRGGLRTGIGILLALLLAGCGDGTPFDSREIADRGLATAAISADGRFVAAGALTQGGTLWSIIDRERRYGWNHTPDRPSVLDAIGFAPDGDFALSAERDSLVLWQTVDGQAARVFVAPAPVHAVALGPQGRRALLGLADGRAVVFDALAGGILQTFTHQGPVRSVALSADGRRALTGSDDHSARLWDADSGAELQRWTHGGEVRLVALSADGTRALSVSKYDRSVVWDTQTGLEVGTVSPGEARVVRGETFTAAAFDGDGRHLLTGNGARTVQLWSVGERRVEKSWLLPVRSGWKRSGAAVLALGFGADAGVYLCVSADGFIHQLQLAASL